MTPATTTTLSHAAQGWNTITNIWAYLTIFPHWLVALLLAFLLVDIIASSPTAHRFQRKEDS